MKKTALLLSLIMLSAPVLANETTATPETMLPIAPKTTATPAGTTVQTTTTKQFVPITEAIDKARIKEEANKRAYEAKKQEMQQAIEQKKLDRKQLIEQKKAENNQII